MCIHTLTETAGGSKKLGQSISVLDILKKKQKHFSFGMISHVILVYQGGIYSVFSIICN